MNLELLRIWKRSAQDHRVRHPRHHRSRVPRHPRRRAHRRAGAHGRQLPDRPAAPAHARHARRTSASASTRAASTSCSDGEVMPARNQPARSRAQPGTRTPRRGDRRSFLALRSGRRACATGSRRAPARTSACCTTTTATRRTLFLAVLESRYAHIRRAELGLRLGDARSGRGHAAPDRVHLELLPEAPGIPDAAQQREPAPRAGTCSRLAPDRRRCTRRSIATLQATCLERGARDRQVPAAASIRCSSTSPIAGARLFLPGQPAYAVDHLRARPAGRAQPVRAPEAHDRSSSWGICRNESRRRCHERSEST